MSLFGTVRNLLNILCAEAATEAAAQPQFVGPTAALRRSVRGVSTDTRSLKKGDAFVALAGENFDGHSFIRTAAERGAAIAIVANAWNDERERDPAPLPVISVADTLAAYGWLARAHRLQFQIPVIAVAGSNGKTTTKEMIADVLSARYNVLRTEGNLNNLVGVPAMMLRMNPQHTAAVIEIGTNMPGEIESLCRILRPTHGIITNIGREHLELLGTIEGVAQEEGALFRWLAANGGTAFVNLDDRNVARLAKGLPTSVSYSLRKRADLRGVSGPLNELGAPSLAIQFGNKEWPIALQTPGIHTATNALSTFGIKPTTPSVLVEVATPASQPFGGAAASFVTRAFEQEGLECAETTSTSCINSEPDFIDIVRSTVAMPNMGILVEEAYFSIVNGHFNEYFTPSRKYTNTFRYANLAPAPATAGVSVGRAHIQAFGTTTNDGNVFVHELAHGLGLESHKGDNSHGITQNDWVANYPSIMNYRYHDNYAGKNPVNGPMFPTDYFNSCTLASQCPSSNQCVEGRCMRCGIENATFSRGLNPSLGETGAGVNDVAGWTSKLAAELGCAPELRNTIVEPMDWRPRLVSGTYAIDWNGNGIWTDVGYNWQGADPLERRQVLVRSNQYADLRRSGPWALVWLS
ncbi:MAG: hypothetical protein DYG96_15025, partial [Chlorobi bacterium CHB2]|nr:hypothetical protein [Chlorobi bacterium CHB2]